LLIDRDSLISAFHLPPDYKTESITGMGEQSQPAFRPRKYVLTSRIGAVFLAIFIAGTLRTIMNSTSKTHVTTNISPSDWKQRRVMNVTLEAPFSLNPRPRPIPVPKERQDLVNSVDFYQGGSGKGFVVAIMRAVYKGDIVVDADAVAKGGIEEIASQNGDANPKYASEATTVNGLTARFVSYETNVSGRTVHVRGLFVTKANRLWQILVVYFNELSFADASRILKSVRIEP
jgi:hypothetical protein